MKPAIEHGGAEKLALWGGVECTLNRVGERYFDQVERNGHERRPGDIERFAALGIKAIRYPVLWERVAPDGIGAADWGWPDRQLPALREARIEVIAGLVHHGSGPRHASLLEPTFATGLAEYAGAVAARYPWLEYYTPVNEPLTTARFCGLYGWWYPHGANDAQFVRALLNQCRAVVLSMRAIRLVNPRAKLVQPDDLGKTCGTEPMAALATFYNQRRWLAWDLLCGMVDPDHALWRYLVRSGIDASELDWFRVNRCPPDIIGVNYYVTSERWVDHRTERYPPHLAGLVDGQACVDIETVRARATPITGIGPLLEEAWERYRLPLAVTEAHIDAHREDQLRWLLEIWRAGEQVRAKGVDLRAITSWSLLGSFDWNSLVTRSEGYYESGAFDVRFAVPRPTALAPLLRQLGSGRTPDHPVLAGDGWWRRGSRLLAGLAGAEIAGHIHAAGAPILISGASGNLGRAFARICAQRNLAHRLLSRRDMDIADPVSVAAAIARYRPWAIVNASGYVRIDDAEHDVQRCFRENAHGPAMLACACAREGVHLTTFSSDLVFDGRRGAPYVETDAMAPINMYGRSKARGESAVLEACPEALVVRTSAFFGPWDQHNFVVRALGTLEAGRPFYAADDVTVSPTYVPDLVNTCLDLIIDGERGVWHLTNGDPLTWAGLAARAAARAGVDSSRLEPQPAADCRYIAARPRYSALVSNRAILLPTLDSALGRFLQEREPAPPTPVTSAFWSGTARPAAH